MHTVIADFIVSIVNHVRHAGSPALALPHRASPVLSREELRREVLGLLG